MLGGKEKMEETIQEEDEESAQEQEFVSDEDILAVEDRPDLSRAPTENNRKTLGGEKKEILDDIPDANLEMLSDEEAEDILRQQEIKKTTQEAMEAVRRPASEGRQRITREHIPTVEIPDALMEADTDQEIRQTLEEIEPTSTMTIEDDELLEELEPGAITTLDEKRPPLTVLPQQETPQQSELRDLETRIANQRTHIQELQTIYDKAWFGKAKKLRAVELAKERRNILLQERNNLLEKPNNPQSGSRSTPTTESLQSKVA